MFARVRSLFAVGAALTAILVMPSSAAAAGHDIRVVGGYGPDQFAPAGLHREGQSLELRVKIENSALGDENAGNLGFTITWDDQRAELSAGDISGDIIDVDACENAVREPDMGDPYGYDVISCDISPVLEFAPGEPLDFAIIKVPITPKHGATATDWATRDLETFFTVSAAGTDLEGGNNHVEAEVAIADYDVADLGISTVGPAEVEVPVAGTTVTYTSTITNAGPNAAPSAVAYFALPFELNHVSGTAGGVAVTCERAEQSSEYAERFLKLWGCASGPLASGSNRVFTITASAAAGVGEGARKLTLPSTLTIETFAGFAMMDYVTTEDLTTANNGIAGSTSFVAAAAVVVPTCPAGKTGTPPNCVDAPKKFVGGTKAATFVGGTAADTFTGGKGNETFRGGAGNDVAKGGAGNDKLFGDAGNDTLDGGTGNDQVTGGVGNDTARGGAGNDVVSCGKGVFTDKLLGDAGNDKLNCKDGKGGDTINGGAGKDTCVGDAKDKFVGCEKIVRS